MNVLQHIIMFILIGGSILYCLSCLYAFTGHLRRKRFNNRKSNLQVTVIIAARNEEKTLGFLLDDLIKQDYRHDRLRIVVVDDCSGDKTADIARQYAKTDSRITLRETARSSSPFSHKKKAVHEGILNSESDIIMTTDADCRVPAGWVSGMVNHFVNGVELVAGLVRHDGGGIYGRLESLEIAGIQSMAAGLMNAGFPITCNGANLAYRRSAFDRVDGFHNIGNIVSGDDDLLMQKIACGDSARVVFVTGKETTVCTSSSNNPKLIINQRTRWASKVGRYPSKTAVVLLSCFFLFFSALPVWLVLMFVLNSSAVPFIVAFGLKIVGDFPLTLYGVVTIGRPGLIALFPLAECIHVPYIIIVTVKGFFGSFEWRGRQAGALSPGYGDNADDT